MRKEKSSTSISHHLYKDCDLDIMVRIDNYEDGIDGVLKSSLSINNIIIFGTKEQLKKIADSFYVAIAEKEGFK